MIHNLKHGVKNLIRWFKVIWNDKDWDSHFIFKILHKKLSHVENYTRKYGNHTLAERDADKIRVCRLLLDRILKDDYDEMTFKNHDKKWGELKISYGEPDRLGYKTIDITRENAKTLKEKEQESKESSRLYKHSDMLHRQDIKYLFKMMNKHILCWWN